jgi:hypothetical protein
MTTEMIESVRNTLLADAGLIALLGGEYIVVTDVMDDYHYPAISLHLGNEGGEPRTGYVAYKQRDMTPIVQCDLWSKKSKRETYLLAAITDRLFLSWSVPETRSWKKMSDNDLFEKDTKIFHKATRFRFEYTITDP